MTKLLLVTLIALAFWAGAGLGAVVTVRAPLPPACETCWMQKTAAGRRCSFDQVSWWSARSDDKCYAMDAEMGAGR